MTNAEWGTLLLALLLALFVAIGCSAEGKANDDDDDGGLPTGDDDNDAAAGDDDDDDSDDDSGDDDDDAMECWEVWAMCDYENPYDGDPSDECGEEPPGSYDIPKWLDWMACAYDLTAAVQMARADCGFNLGCNDYVYDYYVCEATFNYDSGDCAENAEIYDEYQDCIQDLDEDACSNQ